MTNEVKETKTKVKNENISTEAFKLNKEIPLEAEIRAFLDRSNNKSGLIKDALSMYMHMVNVKGYASPYIQNNVGDWDAIFSNLNVSAMIGKTPQEVKKEVIAETVEHSRYMQTSGYLNNVDNSREEITMDIFDDEENEDNDFDY